MLPASTMSSGTCTNLAPDVCKVPTAAGPIPTPFPNISQCAMSTGTATKVTFSQGPVIHKLSKMSMSSADEAGVAGGVVSNVNMNQVSYMLGSVKVTIEGQQCVYQTCSTGHNGASLNITGLQSVLSQANVTVCP